MADDQTHIDREWARFLAGDEPLLRFGRSLFRFLPSPPRCKLCHAPFRGPGAPFMRLIGKAPWERNPRMCRFCARWLLKKGAGGAEVEVSLVFADVRGSTGLAERMAPREYSGDAVNTTARLAAEAGAGEILITEAAARQARLATRDSARRTLAVKGRTEPLSVYVVSGDMLPR